MRNFIVAIICFTTMICFGIDSTFAQPSLTKISQQQTLRWQANRAIAESTAVANNIPLRVETADGTIFELQSFVGGIPRVYTTYNLTSAKTISTIKVWPGQGFGFALSGSTEILGEWDGGAPRTTHQEFGGRIISTQGALAGHATHVAGTMIAAGVNASAHGMSYQASLQCYDWDNDVAEMASAAASGLRVSNHSYGLITGWYSNFFGDGKWVWFGDTTVSGSQDYRFGFYDDEAQAWDNVAYNAPNYLIAKAAGNDRGEGPGAQPVSHWVFNSLGQQVLSSTVRPVDGGGTGYRTLNGGSTSKNVLVVGAVNPISDGYQQPSDVVMSSFSCWGPTNDGRCKPDIVADGVGLFSSYSSSNTTYATLSGTSMATPSVAGSVGLLLQHQKNLHGSTPLRASTLRGILLHTADDAGNTGPDYVFGWGLMNTLKAAQLMQLDSADGPQSHISELQLLQGDTLRVPVYSDGVSPLKVTICWTDPAGTPPPPSLNPTTIMLVNDLDLRVVKESDQTLYAPWVLNPASPSSPATTGDNIRDNVEQVLVQTPSPGAYTVYIIHKNTLTGGSQYVSLIVGGNVPFFASVISVNPDSAGYALNPGQIVQDSLLVANHGNHTLTFSSSAQHSWLIPDNSVHNVQPADSMYLHYAVDCSALSQWTSYYDSITIASNDSAHPLLRIPINLTTRGPKITVVPLLKIVSADTGSVVSDSFKIFNTGTMPLTFHVADNDSVPPAWLPFGGDSGTIATGDSFTVPLTFDATTLVPGVYLASLIITNNDSSTGNVNFPITLLVNATTVSTSIEKGWNLLSLPVTPSDNLKSHIYPSALSEAFVYNGSYVQLDSLVPGPGYWLRFGASQTIIINGFRAGATDSLGVFTGWNLVGSTDHPVAVSSITSSSPGMVTSRFFGYSNGYIASDTIVPGRGYWVNVNQDGYLILNPGSLQNPSFSIHISPSLGNPPQPPAEIAPPHEMPTDFVLEQAYPNPFNPTTRISYQLPATARVTLTIYNLLGQAVDVLADGVESAGYKSIEWNAQRFTSGVYFYRLDAVGIDGTAVRFSQTRKVLLTK